jgi:hypothetical protein
MNKQREVVTVHTLVENTTCVHEVSEMYTSKHFTEVLILFGQAVRKAALLHINKHIDIVAGVMRSKEMASAHKELMASCCDDCNARHTVAAKMCSFFLDPVTQHQKLLGMYQRASYLYSTLRSGKIHCSQADTFFLEDVPLGQVHHYSCGGDNPPDQGSGDLCLCILIATGLDKAFSGSLTLAISVTATSKLVYRMSAGDTCLLFGMVLPFQTLLFCVSCLYPVTDSISSLFAFRI